MNGPPLCFLFFSAKINLHEVGISAFVYGVLIPTFIIYVGFCESVNKLKEIANEND